jgi:hypothetical protein
MDNAQALLLVLCDEPASNSHGIVGGIIEDLNLQPVPRVIKSTNSSKEPTNHIALVVNGELNRDQRKIVGPRGNFEFPENTTVF